MTKNARIVGKVEYREGDGPNILIRPGPCQVDEAALDVTISWTDGETHGSAAMPISNFRRYVDSRAILIDGAETISERPADKDLSEQARRGHGVPSQDPNPAAQLPLDPAVAEREANSVLAGGGVVVGVATGVAIGGAVGGPVGAVVGGTVGAVAGALGGAAAAPLVNTKDSIAVDIAVTKKPAQAR
jgi:hypothetical protein